MERNDHRIQGFIVFRTREDIVVQAFIISGEKINEEKTLKLYACLIIWEKKNKMAAVVEVARNSHKSTKACGIGLFLKKLPTC